MDQQQPQTENELLCWGLDLGLPTSILLPIETPLREPFQTRAP